MYNSRGMSMWQRVQQMIREANYPPQNESRVIRDVCDVNTRYPSLYPRLDQYTSEEGVTQRLVILDGTVPITYRGASYNIPIQIWMMSYHPSGPPIIYVKPTPDMVLKERHNHVDRNGLVYLPYLSKWNIQQSSLLGAIAAMCQVFSEAPPLFSSRNSRQAENQQLERQKLIRDLSQRAQMRFRDVSEEGANDIGELLQRRDDARLNTNKMSEEEQELLEKRKTLERSLEALLSEHEQLEAYITSSNMREGDFDVDKMINPTDIHSEQLLQCMSEDAALSDALDQLMEAICTQQISVDVFTKETKRIARQQFFARALLRKVRLHKAQSTQRHPQSA